MATPGNPIPPSGPYTSMSFANVEPWLSNAPGVNSPVGEMSTYAKTFTRDLGVYKDNSLPLYTFYTLRSVEEQNNTLSSVKVPGEIISKMALLTNWLYNKVTESVGEIYADVLLQELVPYAITIGVSNIQLGPVRQYDGFWMVDWLSFSSDEYGAANTNKVWFALQSLMDEYSHYEIVVVPPITPLDQFFTTGSNVQSMVEAVTEPQRMENIQVAKQGHPETIIRSDTYDYVNPLNVTMRVPTSWPVLIYGPAGNNIDAIKDALINHILANTTHTREEWARIFPDIFKRTEFVIVPHWHKYAVENLTLQNGGVYSPTINYNESLELMKTIADTYPAEHIDQHLNLMGNPYRSLMLSVVGGPDNRDEMFEIAEMFPDFINVSSQNPDFARMSPTTQAWALILQNLVVLAETLSPSTTIPMGYMRVVRGDFVFAVKTFGNVQYLVASKETVDKVLGPQNDSDIDPTPLPS